MADDKHEFSLIVSLKIADTTAITAFRALKEMGFNRLKDLKRYDYYKFTLRGNIGMEEFERKITNVDLLVNANKHKVVCRDTLACDESRNKCIFAVIKNKDDKNYGLLSILRNRLGFSEIEGIEKGVLWSLNIDEDAAKKKMTVAKEIINGILMNRHYQECEIAGTGI